MDDGYGLNGRSGVRSDGYDIGPDEDRYPFTQGTPVDMLTTRFNSNGDMEVEHQQVYISRPSNFVIFEPLDESTSIPEFAHTESEVIRAADERFYSEANRLKTYEPKWLEDYPVRPTDLARNGFIHIGPGDKVKCVFCLRTLRHWDHNDSVEMEHRKHYPDCPFVQGKCDHLNVPLSLSENMNKSFGLKMKTNEQQVSVSVPLMQDFSNRLKTYESWPKQAAIRPDALAEAGLFFIGNGDEVQCFSCRKTFEKWEPGDDPWFEHARWSPNCTFLHSVRGSGYVQAVQERVLADKSTEENTKMLEESEKKYEYTAAGPSNGSYSGSGSYEATPLAQPVQVLSPQIEKDLNNPSVKAVMQIFDIPVEAMRQKLERIRITEGFDYEITGDDLSDMTK